MKPGGDCASCGFPQPFDIPQQAQRRRRQRRAAAGYAGVAVAGALVAPLLAACGQGGSGSVNGVPAINWYIGDAGRWLDRGRDRHLQQAEQAASTSIKEQELPSRATDQREQIVRRLAANDSLHRPHRHGRHLDRRIRERRLALRRSRTTRRPSSPTACCKGPLASGTYQGKLYARSVHVEHAAALVPQGPGRRTAGTDFTWDQMIDQAVSKQLKVQIQGAQAESMTVTFNALLDSAGGTFLNNATQGQGRDDQPRAGSDGRRARRAEEPRHLLGRRPRAEHRRRGQQPGGVREGRLGLRDQLPVHLPERAPAVKGLQAEARLGPLPAGRSPASRASRRWAGSTSASPATASTRTSTFRGDQCIVQPDEPADRRREGR